MFKTLKNLIFGNDMDIQEIVDRGGVFVDVRTPGEFETGHVVGARNIPLQQINNRYSEIDKDKPVIVYCKSGIRSAQAKSFLKGKGYEAHNGGGFLSLNDKLTNQ